jgi:hypothetical protein
MFVAAFAEDAEVGHIRVPLVALKSSFDEAPAKIRALDAHGLRNWAEGFTESVTRLNGHWRSKTVTDDDRRVLKLIADAAKGRAGASELQPLLPVWLARRHTGRR